MILQDTWMGNSLINHSNSDEIVGSLDFCISHRLSGHRMLQWKNSISVIKNSCSDLNLNAPECREQCATTALCDSTCLIPGCASHEISIVSMILSFFLPGKWFPLRVIALGFRQSMMTIGRRTSKNDRLTKVEHRSIRSNRNRDGTTTHRDSIKIFHPILTISISIKAML